VAEGLRTARLNYKGLQDLVIRNRASSLKTADKTAEKWTWLVEKRTCKTKCFLGQSGKLKTAT
jgi:hypothetical protein